MWYVCVHVFDVPEEGFGSRWKRNLSQYWKRGQYNAGGICTFAHGEEELRKDAKAVGRRRGKEREERHPNGILGTNFGGKGTKEVMMGRKERKAKMKRRPGRVENRKHGLRTLARGSAIILSSEDTGTATAAGSVSTAITSRKRKR